MVLLPRKTRCVLAQLRSGYSTFLNSYCSRIDPTIADLCPVCSLGPHDTQHLFMCPKKPAPVGVESLWLDPVSAAQFLGLSCGEPVGEDDDLDC